MEKSILDRLDESVSDLKKKAFKEIKEKSKKSTLKIRRKDF